MTDLAATSISWDEAAGAYTDEPREVTDNSGAFKVGGAFAYAGQTLTLDRIVAGDFVQFKIVTTNESTVKIKYQTVVTIAADSDLALFNELEITMNGEPINKKLSTAVSEWTDCDPEQAIPDITVRIGLPTDAKQLLDDEGNAPSCKLSIGLYAVQRNGNDTTHSNVYMLTNESNFGDVLENVQDGDVVALGSDLVVSSDNPLDINNKSLELAVQNNTLTIESSSTTEGLSVSGTSSLTVNGSNSETGDIIVHNKAGGKGAIDVTGKNAEVNLNNANVIVANDNASSSSMNTAIKAESGAQVNLSGSTITINDNTDTDSDYKKAYGIGATGSRTHVTLDETTVNVDGSAIALYSDNNATMDIVGCEINMVNGGGTVVGIVAGTEGTINSINTMVNITGELSGKFPDGYSSDYKNVVAAYGCLLGGDFPAPYSVINIYGGVINLEPTSGVAFAIATMSLSNYITVYIGGGLVINVNAGEGAQAAAFAIGQQAGIGYYDAEGELIVNLTTQPDNRNIEIWKDSALYNGGLGVGGTALLPESGKMPYPLG